MRPIGISRACRLTRSSVYLLGAPLAALLIGMLLALSYTFLTRQPAERRSFRLLVALTLTLNLAQTAFLLVNTHQQFVISFGDALAQASLPWILTISLAFSGIIAALGACRFLLSEGPFSRWLVQLHFAWRIWIFFEGRRLLPLALAVLAAVSALAGISASVVEANVGSYISVDRFDATRWIVIVAYFVPAGECSPRNFSGHMATRVQSTTSSSRLPCGVRFIALRRSISVSAGPLRGAFALLVSRLSS